MAETAVDTELLIVGAGPAGASLACFLASHGRTGILISAASGTAETPRAHITNMAAMECLRDIGLDRDCIDVAAHGDNMKHTRWCYSMAGEEYARIYSWGHDPKRKGDYEEASPCDHMDLPQTQLEPILMRRATHQGWVVRFDTTLVTLSRPSADRVDCEVRDGLTGHTYCIRARYVFGCDGARSQVMRSLAIPLVKKDGQGLALNLLVRADLSHLVKARRGNLHWVIQPDKAHPPWAWACIVRMVKPWTEWMFIMLPHPAAELTSSDMEASPAEYLARVKEIIGDDQVVPEILDASKWWINEIVAERYSDGGNVFCLGDAVHRHPPFNGLGSNTCIQDAFNLAWKIAYVMSGKAGPGLLDTFTAERQPVGVDVITRANTGLRDHMPWMQAIGMLETDIKARQAILAEFDDPSAKGALRRVHFQRGIEHTSTEFHGLGIEMNQLYTSSAVCRADERDATRPAAKDSIKLHHVTTLPGSRLPHAWLNTRMPRDKMLSTLDLAGHGCFCLITGPGGQPWKDAAKAVSLRVGVPINCYSVGWKQDYEDVYFDWARRREIQEDGCVLVRPDRFVAWRADTLIPGGEDKLEAVMKSVLSL